jgi:hypothetical protein
VARRDEIAKAVARVESALDELELELRDRGEEGSAIVRFALYRVAHRRLVLGGYLTLLRWTRPPFPEEGDEKSKP